MFKQRALMASLVVVSALFGGESLAAVVDFSNRAAFTAATGATSVETFTNTFHFPITSGVLNSSTNQPDIGITPGTILSGVTYSTPVKPGSFFNIDAGGGFDGGFLDTITGPAVLTITFDAAQSAFGFDTNSLMGSFSVTIHGGSGTTLQNFAAANALQFYGFQDTAGGITSVDIISTGATGFGFALDNFTFNASAISPVPELSTWLMMILGFAGVGFLAYRRRKPAASLSAA